MSGSQTFPKLTAEALEEHRQIHFHVDLLSRSLDSLGVSEVDADRMLDVAARIESLRERLEEHFRGEEDSGLYQGILDALPQAETDVMRLMGEHEKMLLDLEGARTIARGKNPADASLLRSELQRVIATLRDHEREEEALVQRALSRP